MYSVPAQETAKDRAKFGWPPVSAFSLTPTRVIAHGPHWGTAPDPHSCSPILNDLPAPTHMVGQKLISCCFFFFFLSFFLAYYQPSEIGYLPYFHTWCGHSANLGCRSETCCTRLAENTGRKKSPKIRHLRTIVQLCRAISSQLRQILTIGNKLVKQEYLLQMSPTML